jgi:hypothetical protein
MGFDEKEREMVGKGDLLCVRGNSLEIHKWGRDVT